MMNIFHYFLAKNSEVRVLKMDKCVAWWEADESLRIVAMVLR